MQGEGARNKATERAASDQAVQAVGADQGSGDLARTVTFPELCEIAYRQRVPLFAQGFYRTPEIHFDPVSGRGKE